MTGFAGVMAIVLAELATGAAAFTWLTPLWHEARRTHFRVYGLVVTPLIAVPGWLAAAQGAVPGDDLGAWAVRLALALAALSALSTVALLLRREALGRVFGVLAVPVGVATLFVLAGTGVEPFALGAFQLLAGAAFLGSVFAGLFLGHWYLTDRKLTRRPIERITAFAIAASVVELVAIASGGFGATGSTSDSLNPLLTAGALAPWIALGSAFTTLVVCVLVKAALRGERPSAVQSATGFYYLAVITALTAEVAVRVRFLG
ncbi:MAG TPA: hypothetical protein VF044_00500 [Actinomycetota bacterium]